MIVWRFKPVGTTNYGDALNDYLWPKLIPEIGHIEGAFYGIGTVLNTAVPKDQPLHVVFGAGMGYGPPPTLDGRWDIRFVRGPHTAAQLGGFRWITDPGILVTHIPTAVIANGPSYEVSYMPRWDTISPDLVKRCEDAGFHVIDPRWDVEKVTQHISDSSLLLSGALHGAIAADTLRVPWVSIYGERGHEFKWRDWCASMEMVWNPIDMMEFTLDWARRNAVPQLSAKSVLEGKKCQMAEEIKRLREDYA